MLSNEVIQDCIDDISQIMHSQLCVFGVDGTLLADSRSHGEDLKELTEYFLDSPADSQQMKGYCFFKLYDAEEVAFIITAQPDNTDGYSAGKLAAAQLGRLMEAYKKKPDGNQFMQNLLLDRLYEADIFNQSKLLGIPVSVSRNVFLVETEREWDEAVLEMIRELYGKSSRNFVTAIDQKSIILVKELQGADTETDIANMLVDMINVEAMSRVRVSYGNRAEELKEIPRSYQEARLALDVGKIFYSNKKIAAYNMLGIGRLIYQLPSELCDMFLREVFGGEVPKKLDEETLTTINKFFELNLNVSETARQLYLHRNTLTYRLERIQKVTGLDIRSFEDAMTLKLALMVAEYRRINGT
ncbi:MAG: PucR family transcriptional regulator [Lachnospiraceae bacterium]|nr:PucR family transcriptional regulator [Lachnospiraceae bacterium]